MIRAIVTLALFTPGGHVTTNHGQASVSDTPVQAVTRQAADWQGGLAPHSEVWWTGRCFLDRPEIRVGNRRLRPHWIADHSLISYPSPPTKAEDGSRVRAGFYGRVVWDGVNLTNNLERSITFTASCPN